MLSVCIAEFMPVKGPNMGSVRLHSVWVELLCIVHSNAV